MHGQGPGDGRPLADGPYGGLFIDEALNEVWVTNQINIMLDYYLTYRYTSLCMYVYVCVCACVLYMLTKTFMLSHKGGIHA